MGLLNKNCLGSAKVKTRTRANARFPRRRFQPALEALEARTVPAGIYLGFNADQFFPRNAWDFLQATLQFTNAGVMKNSATISVTNTSTFIIGNAVVVSDGTTTLNSTIVSVNPNTSITLASPWTGNGTTATVDGIGFQLPNASVTMNSKTIPVTNTDPVNIGNVVIVSDGTTTLNSTIESINPNVSITLADPWLGSTGTATFDDVSISLSAGQVPVTPLDLNLSHASPTQTGATVTQGSQTITVASNAGFSLGQFVEVTDSNTSTPLYSLITGLSSTGTTITLDEAWTASGDTNATVYGLTPLGNSFLTLCWDLQNFLTSTGSFPGAPNTNIFPVTAAAGGALPANADKIAYLFNHFGTTPISNDASGSPAQAVGLQVAIWELEYGSNFQGLKVLQVAPPNTNSPAVETTNVNNAASAFISNANANTNGDTATFLQVNGPPVNGGDQGFLASPMITTIPNPTTVTLGMMQSNLNDTAVLSGGVAPTGTITFYLFAPGVTPNATDSNNVYSSAVTVNGNGSYDSTLGTSTGSNEATQTGTYNWLAVYSGDLNNSMANSGFGSEPVMVSPATPAITTSQQPPSATVGSSIADKATVSGLVNPTSGDTVTFNLYSSATVQNSSTLLFSNTQPLSVTGSTGMATSAGYTATATGTDYWVATFNGDSNNTAVSSGATAEPVMISDEFITITPSGTNVVGNPHTFTATVFLNTGDGTGYHPAPAGQTVTVSLTNSNGAMASPAGPFNLTTNSSGQVSVTFTSQTAGIVTGSASTVYTVGSSSVTRTTGDSYPLDGPVATKVFEDEFITIAPNATNVVGFSHTFVATVYLNIGNGTGFNPVGTGTAVTVTLTSSGGATISPITPSPNSSTATTDTYNLTTNSSGQVSVTFTSFTAGTVTGSATTTLTILGGGSITRMTGDPYPLDGPVATKIFVPPPTITTTPGGSVTIGSGARLTDSATLSGGVNPTNSITFYLLPPGSTAGTPLSSAVYTNTVTVSGDGVYTTAMGTNPGGYLPTTSGSYQWIAVYSGDAHNPSVSSNFGDEPESVPSPTPPTLTTMPGVVAPTTPTLTTTPSLVGPPAPCNDSYYPNTTSDALTSVAFNESSVLAGISPSDGTTLSLANGTLQVFFNDETAMALGVSQVTTITSSGTTTQNYAVSPLPSDPGSVANPQVGAPYTPPSNLSTVTPSGLALQGGTDVSGRPLFPSLYITDITGMDPNSVAAHAGDWQYGGTPLAPDNVYGTWKSFTETIDKTTATPTITLNAGSNPAQNGWNLGSPDTPPSVSSQGYGAEVTWNVSSLNLTPGHSYRFYVIVHDGDQNKAGGDVGQACVNLLYTGTTSNTSASLNDAATLSGGNNPTGRITFYLFAPGVTPNSSTNPTNFVYADVVPVSGNGTYTTAMGSNPGGYLAPSPGIYQWVASYTGDANNTGVLSPYGSESDTVAVPPCNDNLYPFSSSNALTNVPFNESSALAATSPADGMTLSGGTLTLWYTDEHAMALGVSQVTIKTSSGTTTTNYPVSALSSNPGSVTNPQVGGTYTPPTSAQLATITPGALAASQAQGNTDTSGRPLFPSLFVTDITGLDPASVAALAGDWQYGGTPLAPSAVYGTWKSFTETIDQTTATPTVTLTAGSDPTANGWNLGTGSTAPPAGTANLGYGTQVVWNVNSLGLIPGHVYRFYVIVHDGDQNKSGGDVGQACLDEVYSNTPVPSTPPVGSVVTSNTSKLNDTATISGGSNPTGTITFYLLPPGSTSSTPLSSAVYTDTVTVSGNGTYSTATGTHPGGYLPTSAGTYQWVVVYAGDSNNNGVTSTFGSESETVSPASPTVATSPGVVPVPTLSTTAGVVVAPAACNDTYYPNTTSDALTGVAFNESSALAGISPSDGTTLSLSNGTLQVFFNDETAMALGVSQITTITSSGTTTQNYAVSPLPSDPGSVANPQVGAPYTPPSNLSTVTPASLALQGGTDVSGRPLFPSLYITDITGLDPNSVAAHAGDWQYGGTPLAPNNVYGTWKSFTETIDKTTATPTITLSAGPNPAQNGWNLGSPDTPPSVSSQGFGAEMTWNINSLGLIPGHSYRFYVIVHDGDQNKAGGDVGQACVNLLYTGATPGGTILTDSATLAGATNPTGNVTFLLFAPGVTPSPSTNPTNYVYKDMVPVSGNGTYTTAMGNNPGGYLAPSPGIYQWVVTYNGDSNNPALTSPFGTEPDTVAVPPCNETYYPFSSGNNALTNVPFNESSALAATSPTDGMTLSGGTLTLWYTDEHAMALGVSQVTIKTSSGTTTKNYAVSPQPSDPASVTNPQVGGTYTAPTSAQLATITPGALAASQAQGNTDTSGRPLFPSLFITDITGLDPNSVAAHAGDWQYGGSPLAPSAVYGTWKSFTETINQTTATPTVSLTAGSDPAANGWNLGPGSTAPPTGTANLGYGTEVVWNVNSLGLIPGHVYRFYVIVHDGDQNQSGGDVGQACLDEVFSNTPVTTPPVGTAVTSNVKLTDTATLAGGNNPTGSITFYLLPPGSTASTPLSSAVYTDKATVSGNGLYTTSAGSSPGGYLPTTTGTYEWVVVYSGDNNNQGATSPFGSEPETVNLPLTTVTAGTPTRSAKQVTVPLTNQSTLAETLTGFQLIWPSADGNLQNAQLAGKNLYNPPGGTPWTAAGVNATTLAGAPGDRTINPGKTSNLVFNFQNNAVSGTYTIKLTFADGSTLSITPTIPQLAAGSSSPAGAGVTELLDWSDLQPGTIPVAVDLPPSGQTAAEQAAIARALARLDADLRPLGVDLVEVAGAQAAAAPIHLNLATTSAIGGVGEGVLAAFSASGDITLISGWDWYLGADPSAIAANQYDFQTVVTHELGHVLGLGESSDPSSVMYLYLAPGQANRSFSAEDLNAIRQQVIGSSTSPSAAADAPQLLASVSERPVASQASEGSLTQAEQPATSRLQDEKAGGESAPEFPNNGESVLRDLGDWYIQIIGPRQSAPQPGSATALSGLSETLRQEPWTRNPVANPTSTFGAPVPVLVSDTGVRDNRWESLLNALGDSLLLGGPDAQAMLGTLAANQQARRADDLVFDLAPPHRESRVLVSDLWPESTCDSVAAEVSDSQDVLWLEVAGEDE